MADDCVPLMTKLRSALTVLGFVQEHSTQMNAVSLRVYDVLWDEIATHCPTLPEQDQQTLALMIVTGLQSRLREMIEDEACGSECC